MNRSYSKMRHIQEANELLEKRMLMEQQKNVPAPTTGSQQAGRSSQQKSLAVKPAPMPPALGEMVNFYPDSAQTQTPLRVSLSNRVADTTINQETGVVTITIPSNSEIRNLQFNCSEQNQTPGKFLATKNDGSQKDYYNKSLADDFANFYCSKNQNGQWVQKVSNPKYASIDTQQNQQTA